MGDLFEFLAQNEGGFRPNRLPALYSDFRGLRATNPDGYAANVAAWRRGLASIARSGLAPPPRSGAPSKTSSSSTPSSTSDILVLNTDDNLLRALESRQYGRPLALGAVVQEAVAEGDLIPLSHFLTAKQSIYRGSSSWGVLPWAALTWGLRQAGLTGWFSSTDSLPKGQFVVLANVEAAGKAFAERTSSTTSSRFERTWSKAHFIKSFADSLLPTQHLSTTDLNVLLTFLSRDKGLVSYDGDVIKVKDPSATQGAGGITSEDAAIAQLRELTEYLTHQTTLLNKRIEDLTAAAKEAVTKKNRVSALAALRSKKQAESSLQTRFATLAQLEEVSAKIEQASDQVQLVKVMASSADALRSLNRQTGDAEQVGSVVDRLREQMDAVDEVGSILAEAAVLDEGEVDDELAMLEREEGEKVAAEERVRQEAAELREAEETRRRLEAVEQARTPLPGVAKATLQPHADSAGGESVVRDATEGIGRMSLEEQRLPQPAS